MRSKVTLPWNAAAWRQSTYEPRVRKVHGPVGERVLSTETPLGYDNARNGKQPWFSDENGNGQQLACQGCGYHVCSCEPAYTTRLGQWDAEPEPREYIPPHELKLMKEQLERQQRIVPVPPNPGPAGPRVVPFGTDNNYVTLNYGRDDQ